MEDLKLIYPKCERNILINYFEFTVIQENNIVGNFQFENDILKIIWNNGNEDFFKKNMETINDILMTYTYFKSNYKINININNIIHKFTVDEDKIYNIDDKTTFYNIEKINEILIKINIHQKYNTIFELKDDDIYYDITDNFNEIIEVHNYSWIDNCIINKMNYFIYRESDENEYGYFEMNEYNLKIYWKNWNPENFQTVDYKKYIIYKSIYDIYIYHKDWNEECVIEDNNIYRKSNPLDYGTCTIENNILTIFWKSWEKELFYELNNVYYDYKLIKYLELNNEKYIVNLLNNKLYDIKNNNVAIINISDYNINIIWNDDKEKKYDFIEDNNIIFVYENILKEIIIIKYIEEIVFINTINNKIYSHDKSKEGIFKIENELLNIFWNTTSTCDTYIFKNNKYYYKDFDSLNEKIFYLFDIYGNYKKYISNYFNHLLYNEYEHLKFLNNQKYYYIIENDILQTYFLNIIDEDNIYYILINEEVQNNIYGKLDYIIYKKFHPNILHLNILDIYHLLLNEGIYQNHIYSIQSFLNNYPFFNIECYMNNNSINNKKDAIIHFHDNGHLSKYFYSNNIEIVYDNMFKYNIINEDIDEIVIDDNIYILNIKDENELDNVFSLDKNNNILIHINFYSDLLILFEKKLIEKYENLILCKSKKILNYESLDFMITYLKNKKIYFDKVIYINDFDKEKIINQYTPYISKNSILIDNKKRYNILTKINYLYFLIKYAFSKIDMIILLLFYYIIKKKIYDIIHNNFIIKFSTIINIMNNSFNEKIIFIKF